MELTCKQCGSQFRAALQLPLTRAVRVACPSCGTQMVLKPTPPGADASIPAPSAYEPPSSPAARNRRVAVIADEPRAFRTFLGEHLRRLGFDVTYFEAGDAALEFVRRARAH